MSVRHFVGDEAVAATPDHDRGLAYGDGLFETMRAHYGAVHRGAREPSAMTPAAAARNRVRPLRA